MFNELLIHEGSVRNITDGDEKIGFQFDTHLSYYRGLGLSMVEEPRVRVDGVDAAPNSLRFGYRDQTWTFDELAEVTDIRWELRDYATLTVLRPGGLPAGQHRIELTQVLRVSYLPMLLENSFTREVAI